MDKQVADTSIAAYQDLLPTLGKRERDVLNALTRYQQALGAWPTAYELVRWMQRDAVGLVDLNTVRPRLCNLQNRRPPMVQKAAKRRCSVTKKLAYTWELVFPGRLF